MLVESLTTRNRLLNVIVFSGALAFSGCGGGTSGGGGGDVTGDFVKLANAHRQSVGCGRLTWDDRLAAIAQGHSNDMDSRNFFAHTNPDGTTVGDRLRSVGFSSGAENLASGSFSAQSLLDAWLQSPSHRANIENCVWTMHGVGQSGSFVTHNFAT